jgi:[NiFe] hydrogenase diaphorase moiety large subunit
MSETIGTTATAICEQHGRDRTRLMDIMNDVQAEYGYVPTKAITVIARELAVPRVEVESFVSFYAFLSQEPKGKIVIRLCNDIVDRMQGFDRIAALFCEELGIGLGETTPDGRITLETTACIGMSDQAPAALINDVVFTELSTDKVRHIVQGLREHGNPRRLVTKLGDGNNADYLVQAMVNNNIRKRGPIIFSSMNRGEAIRKALGMSPAEVIRAVKTSRLLGRGGAGFPTGLKWEFTRSAEGEKKYVLCNADEGEPGTFKDRVILTELPDRLFAGMTVAGYAIGAEEGILYLRGEYAYLREYLEAVLQKRRNEGLLGESICGGANSCFNFEIRIQMGAGAYVCGEETAMISSCEGLRGDPKTRPPFPAQRGYLGYPTVVNNVETYCCVTKVLEEGPASFSELGTAQSSGTKLLSVSGDCRRPGVFEVPFGISLREVLHLAGGDDAIAVQVSGPAGQMIGPEDFDRIIGFEDLATGGSIIILGPGRNVLEVAHAFMEFFEDESCGYCTPCRVGNTILKHTLEKLMAGGGEPGDLERMEELGRVMKACSRCGLGQTSANPVITSLKSFRPLYEGLIQVDPDGFRRSFDLDAALAPATTIAGRPSVHTH